MLNFGAIGFSIGHELSHAFDDNGRKYGGEGDLEDWWSKDTVDKFKHHTECLVEQYHTSRAWKVGENLVSLYLSSLATIGK